MISLSLKDNVISKRNENFTNCLSNQVYNPDILNNQSLSLRKKKVNLMIHLRRCQQYNQSQGIKSIDLNSNNNNSIALLQNITSLSSEDLYNKLQAFAGIINDTKKELIIEKVKEWKVIPLLHSIIPFNILNEDIVDVIVFIMITISHSLKTVEDIEELFTSESTYIQNYCLLTQKCKDNPLHFSRLLLFFGDIIKDSNNNQNLFIDKGIFEAIYLTYSLANTEDELQSKIWFFSLINSNNIFDDYPEISLRLLNVYNETTIFLASNINEQNENDYLITINYCINGLGNITHTSCPKFYEEIFSMNIIEYFIDFKTTHEYFIYPTVLMIGNLLGATEQKYILRVIKLGGIEYLTSHYKPTNSIKLNEVIHWALNNVLVDQSLSMIVLEKNLIDFLLDVTEISNLSYSSIKEILWGIMGLADNMINEYYIKLKESSLIKKLVHWLSTIKHDLLMEMILKTLLCLFQNDYEKVFIKSFLNMGGEDIIERLLVIMKYDQKVILCENIKLLYQAEQMTINI